MKKSKKQTVKTIVFMFFFSAALIALYFFIRTRTNVTKTDPVSSMSEVDKLLTKDMKENYPSSPREVLKLYSRMTKCFFNEDLNLEQVEKMAVQLRQLFDDELLLNNPYDNYILDLNVEISEYRNANRTIMNYIIDESSSVKYWESDDENYASISVSYTVKENTDYSKVYENFLLRQDSESRWKIMGWELTGEKETEPDN